MKRKNFLVTTVLIAVLVVLSLAPMAQAQEMADTIRVSVVAGAMQETMQKLADAYMEQNPGTTVTLELEPEGGAFQALVAAGNQPDVIITSFGPQLGTLVADGVAVPLDDLEGADALFERIAPESLTTLSGNYYYVPLGADVTLMIYNKELFEEAGLDPENPPATWDEFLSAAEAIDNLGSDIYGTVFWNDALFWGGWYWNMLQPIYLNANQDSCQLMNRLGTDIVFDDEECQMGSFLQFLDAAQDYAPPTMETNFFSRKVGMWLQYGYSWEPNLESAADEPMVIGEDVGIAPVPVPEAGDTSFTTYGGRAMMILKTDPSRQTRAWDFIQFMMQDENNATFIKELGYLPVLESLKDDEYFQDPARQTFVEVSQNGVLPEQFAAAEKAAVQVQAVIQAAVVEDTLDDASAVETAVEQAREAIAE
ncbi:MAG: extracellular solute-binding protein [Anaerolineae bacterium]|nr:extracellular solute-binding protein [Anaerolineae bacterium]